jgi:gliding motility-associated-like protein
LKAFNKITLLLISFFLYIQEGAATHIVGGEITYRDLGNFNYEVTLKLYRDCHNGQAPYDDPTYITIFNSVGKALYLLPIAFPGSRVLPIVLANPCLKPPTDVCVEEAIFIDTVHLPPIPGGYQLSYERCCRNRTLVNIVNPLGTGATYYTVIPDTSVVLTNSSPKYNNFPPIFICANQPISFDHAATDPDGDSLVYELCTPYLGADDVNPYPVPSHSPPYSFVTYNPGFNANNPLGYDPVTGSPLTIDPQTGFLTGKPNLIGQFVVGVCVSEYRNGVLLSVNKRDFQFNVTNCPPVSVAALPSNIKECGYTITFQNQSINAFNTFWDFGDPTTLADTSGLFSPTYTYPDTGNYTITLIVNKGLICADTATSVAHIYHSIDGADFTAGNACAFTPIQFSDISSLTEGPEAKRLWNFGDGVSDSIKNPLHTYTFPKNYTVSLIAYNKNGCTDTSRKTITIFPLPLPDAGNDTTVCHGITFQLHGSGGSGYLWNDSPELSCTSCSDPLASPLNSTTYKLTVTNAFGCMAKDSVHISLRPVIIPADTFTYIGRCYSDPVQFFGQARNFDFFCRKNIQWQWDFGDGSFSSEQNPEHKYAGIGPYTVTLKVSSDSPPFRQTLSILPPDSCLKNIFVPNTFTPNGDGMNDIVYLRTINAKKILFRIYNRWGEEVFRTENLHTGWDGTYKGEKLTPQVFVFQADVTFYDDSRETKKGNITLVE